MEKTVSLHSFLAVQKIVSAWVGEWGGGDAFGASYSSRNKFLLVVRHTLTMPFKKCL